MESTKRMGACILMNKIKSPTSYFLLPTSYLLLPTSYLLLPTSYLIKRKKPAIYVLRPLEGSAIFHYNRTGVQRGRGTDQAQRRRRK